MGRRKNPRKVEIQYQKRKLTCNVTGTCILLTPLLVTLFFPYSTKQGNAFLFWLLNIIFIGLLIACFIVINKKQIEIIHKDMVSRFKGMKYDGELKYISHKEPEQTKKNVDPLYKIVLTYLDKENNQMVFVVINNFNEYNPYSTIVGKDFDILPRMNSWDSIYV